jgi:hypothetical protein
MFKFVIFLLALTGCIEIYRYLCQGKWNDIPFNPKHLFISFLVAMGITSIIYILNNGGH